MQIILTVEWNEALTTFSPILQWGISPYSTLLSNQAPEISIGVPPLVKPELGSTFLT